MGVQGLWTVVQPCARPTNLATLNRKRLAVDASIWIYQFLKAVRDKEGNALRNSHVVGFFRRLCKLLWYGVKPVFVFDGGAPALKRATLQGRRRRREGRREDAARTAGKLLAVQMHRIAEEEEERRQRRAEIIAAPANEEEEQEQEQLPSADQIVYADELGMSKQERLKTRRFHKKDAYHLPELENGIEAMGKPDDPRIMSVEELEEYARQFNEGEDINLYDFSKIDFDGDFFKSLPPADRYNILNAARLRSRLRMGLSKEQLNVMFPNRMDFSRFQIERVRERNNLTQRLMQEMGMTGLDLTIGGGVSRVVGDKNREYILVKNEGAEGGWALGVVSRDKDQGKIHKPIDVDALEFRYQAINEEGDDEFEDEEFEDVPIEGFNRLPKISNQAAYQQAQDYGSARRQFYNSRQSAEADEDEEALFVNNDNRTGIAGDEDALLADEDEDLNRAIALSLQNDHGTSAQETQDEELENVPPPPQWKQKAAETSRPITAASGSMIAHIVNNRANAAIPKRQENDDESDSDSDLDLQSALRAARKKQPKPKPVKAALAKPNVKNPFGGPLPFEKLDWRTAFGRAKPSAAKVEKPAEKPQQTETAEFEDVPDDEAGGFEKEPSAPRAAPVTQEDKPRPLPPWLTDTTDIRESVRRQQELDMQMNAEDEELARGEELRFLQQQKDAIVEIGSSSDDDSDIEILDAPPLIQPPSPKQSEVSLPQQDSPVMVMSESPAKATTDTELPEATPKEATPKEALATPSEETQRQHSPDWPEDDDEDMEFEDVILPVQAEQPARIASPVPESEEARIERELFGDPAYQPENPTAVVEDLPLAGDVDDLFLEGRDASPEYYEFSDPEEEELLAQMAEEAEEHARFASQLNNKSHQENQEAYEKELRALRTQQKKDRRDADEVTQIMVAECQALLKLFGIPYITAPMEAEAQCAELVRLGLVDGIVTDDSDTFLFGGTRVYKNMFNSNKFVECYLARDLEEELELSREQLIALAQLLGSDYTEGLPGIGPVTAVEILSEFPGREGVTQFRDWWEEVHSGRRPKEADQTSSFRRKFRRGHFPKLFLPPGFPSPAVFDAYLHPEVDSSPEAFQWGVPDLEGLRQFLMSTIGWSKERTDEVLVPVIRDMNKRDLEGTQANITRYFEGAVGAGAADRREAFAPRQRATGSKRMAEAVGKLKARKKKKEGGLSTELPVAIPVPKEKGAGKGRKRKAKEVVVIDEVEEEDGGEQEEEEGEDEEEDVDDVNTRRKGKGQAQATRGIGRGKRSKASV